MNKILIAVGALVLLAISLFGWYKSGYDTMISLDQQVQSGWAQVENQLQRRFDLIPNLVQTVQGYSNHEKSLLEEITHLRSQWTTASTMPDKVDTANALTGALSKLLMVTENYPNLKANENFLTLQSQLEGTENRLTVERMRYNQAVEKYNAYQQSFFGRFFSSQTGKTQPAHYFKSAEAATHAPVVKF